MSIPAAAEAQRLLQEAEEMNPGPWVAHSRFVALAARAIAERHPDLDPERAHTLGLLHDLGYMISGAAPARTWTGTSLTVTTTCARWAMRTRRASP